MDSIDSVLFLRSGSYGPQPAPFLMRAKFNAKAAFSSIKFGNDSKVPRRAQPYCGKANMNVSQNVAEGRFIAKDIDNERNAAIRSLMLARYGLPKYVMASGADEIHRDTYGVLFHKVLPDGEPARFIQVTNKTAQIDGSFRTYLLAVSPDVMTAKQAVAWTFGLDEHDYDPFEES